MVNKILQIADASRAAKAGGQATTPRPKYNGGLSTDELARPGGRLLAMLVAHSNELGHKLGDLADALGVTYGYIHQLRCGKRQTAHISDRFAAACALYLGVPKLTVLLAAGKLSCEDVFDAPKMVWLEVPRALQYVYNDPEYGHLVPLEVLEASLPTQFLVVTLYEKATGRRLLPPRITAETAAEAMMALERTQESLRAAANTEETVTID